MSDLKVLAVIGARAGSKGLPGKNIKILNDKPLLAWPIQIAKSSKYINRILFSSDSEEYAKIAREYGAETPFLRPSELSLDSSIVIEYIKHALEWLEKNESYVPDVVVYLCPTTPLVHHTDIDKAIELLLDDEESHSAVLVSKAKNNPHKMVKISPNLKHAVSYITEKGEHVAPSNRQSYEPAYNRESLPVISRRNTIVHSGSQSGEKVLFHVIPEERAYDIDTELDFFIVEKIMNEKLN
jgi:CMP-N,N'-diacetyllegionaminic acid synthase